MPDNQDRRLEFIEGYELPEDGGPCPCPDCGAESMFIEPDEDCPSFEHQAVYQTWCAHYWREVADRLNPSHHMHHQELTEPVWVDPAKEPGR